MNVGQDQIYQQNRLTFILTPEKVVIRTSLPQTFFLEPRQNYWQRKLKLIRTMIMLGEIQNLHELAEWTGHGIAWIPTNMRYDLPEKDLVLK